MTIQGKTLSGSVCLGKMINEIIKKLVLQV